MVNKLLIFLDKKQKVSVSYKGMTLVELLVSLGILAVAVVLMGGILISVVRAYRTASVLSSIKLNGNAGITLLTDQIRSAQKVECFHYENGSVTVEEVPLNSTCSVRIDNPDKYGGLIISNSQGDKKELGFVPQNNGDCNLNTQTNGFIYYMDYDPNATTRPTAQSFRDLYKVTNDSNTAEGSNLIPGNIYSNSGTLLTINNRGMYSVTFAFTVQNPVCNSVVEKSEVFQSTVVPRQRSGN